MTKRATTKTSKRSPKIALSESRDIPLNKLVLSQANVRKIKANVSIEELAEDIARRTLLQSLTVRAVIDESGAETGMFEVPAGGRRFRALELLVKQKRLARNAPIPCVIRTEGLAEEDSLAENVQRVPLHPLDQFRAFQALREKGQTEEEIAAAFFVSVGVVKQRLRLASVSSKLLHIYAEDEMTLDQLMAFTVNPDHERQEQVFEAIQRSYSRQPYEIKRMLTDGAVRASDKRAQFIGIEAYEEVGGVVLRDLFQTDDGGWLQDAALLDQLVIEKLDREADTIRAQGWKWVEVAIGFPYGHTYDLRRIVGEAEALTEEEQSTLDTLQAEIAQLEDQYAEAEEFSEEADARFSELETVIAALEERPLVYDDTEKSKAGVFVSIDGNGSLRVERGYVRPEDEAPVASDNDADGDTTELYASGADASADGEPSTGNGAVAMNEDDDDKPRPLPDRLVTELTAYRTVALRDAVARNPEIAFAAALHALCLKLFYRYGLESCLELQPTSAVFGSRAPGLEDTSYANAVEERHAEWAAKLPKDADKLWETVLALEPNDLKHLFAHCIALTVNAVRDSTNPRPKAIAHADQLAQAVGLDMAERGWTPTVETYIGRVTKAQILEAVREAKGNAAAQMIDHLKKADMAKVAEDELVDTGWLPEPLRTPGADATDAETVAQSAVYDGEPVAQSAEDGGEPAIDVESSSVDTDRASPPGVIAAE